MTAVDVIWQLERILPRLRQRGLTLLDDGTSPARANAARAATPSVRAVTVPAGGDGR